MAKARKAKIARKTRETQVTVELSLDGSGIYKVATGNGMLDHLVEQLARHGLFDIMLNAKGDTSPGWHHLVEDVGIVLGRAFAQAVGDGAGIQRMGHAIVPLDEALALVAVDISGRGYAVVEADFEEKKVQELPPDLVRHFLESFAIEARIALHVKTLSGTNDHHKAEAIFKALAKALRDAVTLDERLGRKAPSTKGTISG